MRHTETHNLTGKAVAAAVAAALFTMGSPAEAAAVTYPQISESITSPDTDAIVTYTDETDPAIVKTAPVVPGSDTDAAAGITLTLKSLTVTNQTTGNDTVRCGLGISAVSGLEGTGEKMSTTTGGVHLAVSGDVTVTSRANAIETADNNNVDGTIGGNLTLESTEGDGILGEAGSHYPTLDRGVLLTLSGGRASITSDGAYGIETDSSTVKVRIEGASDTVVTSKASFGVFVGDGGEVDLFGSGTGGAGGKVTVQSLGSAVSAIMVQSEGYVTAQAGSVRVEDTAEYSAAVQVLKGAVQLTSLDAAGTGVQVFNNSAESPTIYSGQSGSVTIQAQSSPIQVINEGPGPAIWADSGSVQINNAQMSTGVQVQGNISSANGSAVGIFETGTGSFLKADTITTTGAGDGRTDIVLAGDAAYTSLTGGTSEASADGNNNSLSIVESDTASALANVTLKTGASGTVILSGKSSFTGNITADGVAPDVANTDDDMNRSVLTLILSGDSAYKGNTAVTAGSHVYGTFEGASTLEGDVRVSGTASDGTPSTWNPSTWNINGSGTGSVTGNVTAADGAYAVLAVTDSVKVNGNYTATGDKSIVYLLGAGNSVITGNLTADSGSAATVALGDSAVLNGDVTAAGAGTKVTEDFEAGTTVNGNLVSSNGAAVTTQLAGTWNGTSTLTGGTADVTMTDAAAVWNIASSSEVTSLTQGSGTIHFPAAAASGFTGTTLTVDGNYSSDGGTVSMNTVLQGDTSPHDEIVVKGSTAGSATLVFTKVSGSGSQTVDGIRVVQVGGASDAVFTKPDSNRLTAGAYIYELKKVGNDWYLTSERDPNAPVPVLPNTHDDDTPATPAQPDVIPAADPTNPATHIVKPELGSYTANLIASNTLFTMSLADRLGETRYSDALKDQKHSGNLWIRTAGGRSHSRMMDDQLTNRGTWGLVQVGGDVVSWPGAGDHRFHAGLMMGYAHQSEKTRSTDI